MLEFVKSNVSNWVDGYLWYDERVPRWALAPVLVSAVAGTVVLALGEGPQAGQMPSATLLPVLVASVAIAAASLTKWIVLDDARSVPLACAAGLWSAVTWLGVAPSPDSSVWPPFALLFLSPLLVPALGRGWAMFAWHYRLERAMRETRAVMQTLLDGHPQEGAFVVRVDAVEGDSVDLTLLDGRQILRGLAHRSLWATVSPGRWYLARGVSVVRDAAEVVRIVGATTLEFLGVVDPRTERDPETFVPEMVFWLTSLIALLVLSMAGAWMLASLAG